MKFWGAILHGLAASTTTTTTNSRDDAHETMGSAFDDVIFNWIEEQQQSAGASFGHVLDAGTGLYSLKWLVSLHAQQKLESFTAVTAEEAMHDRVARQAYALGLLTDEDINHVLLGDWFADEDMKLPHPQYDTILAEYLIGAIDGFSPFRQEELIPKLCSKLKPGGSLFIVGWKPIPDREEGDDGNIICKVQQARDACIRLAGQRTYREYPLEWVLKQVENCPDLNLKASKRFAIHYRHEKVVALINGGRKTLPFFPTKELADAMAQVLNNLEAASKEAIEKSGPIEQGEDYVVCVTKAMS